MYRFLIVWIAAWLCGCVSLVPPARHAAEELAGRSRPVALRGTAPPAIAAAATRPEPPREPAPTPAVAEDPVARLHADSVERFSRIHSYIARLRRREVVKGQAKPEELLMFGSRRQPLSVRFKWIGEVGSGREVVWVDGQHGGKIHIRTAAGDIPLTPAGKKLALSPDSMLVRSASNEDIRQSGIGGNIEELGRFFADARDPASGIAVRHLGPVPRPEYPVPLEAVEVRLPPGRDVGCPNGCTRIIHYDPDSKLPVVYLTLDGTGAEVRYSCYDRLMTEIRLDDADFDPDQLWPSN